jgi:hypothetical protein
MNEVSYPVLLDPNTQKKFAVELPNPLNPEYIYLILMRIVLILIP